MRDIALTGLFLCMAALALRYAHLGMMLWAWSALFPPNEYVFGFAHGIPFNKISVACTLIGFMFDKRRRFTLDALMVVLLLFFLEASAAYAISSTPPGWGSDLYERLSKVVVAALFVRFVAVDRLRLHSLILAVCLAIGTGATDEGLKFIASSGGHHSLGPPSWGDENSTATIILMVMPLLLYIYRYSANTVFRYGCLFVFSLCAIAVVGTYSRGGFVGLAILGGALLTSAKHRVRTLIAISILVLVGYVIAPQTWFERIQSTTNAEEDKSFMGRVIQWKILTLMALDHPLLGNGILANAYPPMWSAYAARLNYELTFIPTPPPTTPYASHSIYFQVLGENGFTGLTLFLSLLFCGFRAAKHVKLQASVDPSLAWSGDMAKALRLSLILYLITGALLPIPYTEAVYVILGCMSALKQIQTRILAGGQSKSPNDTSLAAAHTVKVPKRLPLRVGSAGRVQVNLPASPPVWIENG